MKFGGKKEPEKRHTHKPEHEASGSETCHYCGDPIGADSIDQHESTCVQNPYRND